MGKFSDTRRHRSWNRSYINAQVLDGENEEEVPVSRMVALTAPFGEGGEIPRIFTDYEKKLKYNPGIQSDLYETIASAVPHRKYPLPDEDDLEIITSKSWHPDLFDPEVDEAEVKEEALRYFMSREPDAVIKKTVLLRVETEHCLVICVMM